MKAKRLTALLLLVVTLIGMLPGAALAANTPGEALGEIAIYNGGEQLAYLAVNGRVQKLNYVYFELHTGGQIKQIPAYCVNPTTDGVPQVVGKGESIKYLAENQATDPKIVGIVGNGYPHRSLEELGKQMKKLGMLIVQDQVWGRVTANRSSGKSTRYYMDEMHLLLKEEQTAAYSVEIWKRFRKWGGIPTGLTQNVKDLLSSREVENIFENSDMIIMLNQAAGDRQILAKQLNISPHQLSYVTHSGEGEGLLFFGNVILPFVDRFPTDLELYRIMTTKLGEVSEGAQK